VETLPAEKKEDAEDLQDNQDKPMETISKNMEEMGL